MTGVQGSKQKYARPLEAKDKNEYTVTSIRHTYHMGGEKYTLPFWKDL